MNKKAYYINIKAILFGGRLTQGVVNTTEAIFNEFNNSCISDYRIIAYTLATAYAECYSAKLNPEWLPVREGFSKSDAGAIKAVQSLYKAGKITRDYSVKVNGKSYYGRGLAQITHADNYLRIGNLLGIDLINNPDSALDLETSVKILVHSIYNGWFTGKKITNYITPSVTDFINSRRTVNGTDKANEISKIAGYFYNALIQL